MLRVVLTLVAVGLTVYAALDCLRTAPSDVRALPKPVWLVLIVLVPFLGPGAWLLAGRSGPGDGGGGRPAPRTVAPDDDPDFLLRLDLERRKREREERLARGESDDTVTPDEDGPDRTPS